ncbi:inorganic phosphate cotransporter, partial [Trichonephila clavata]
RKSIQKGFKNFIGFSPSGGTFPDGVDGPTVVTERNSNSAVKGYLVPDYRSRREIQGFFGPAICLTAVAFLGCRPIIIVVLLSLAMGLNGFAFSGFICTHVDMSPDFAGTLYGFTNCFSNFTGFMVPAFVGWIIEDGQTVRNWGIVFVTAAVILLITGVIYDIFCSAESQPWGVREIEHPLEKKPLDKEDGPSRYNPNMCSSKI